MKWIFVFLKVFFILLVIDVVLFAALYFIRKRNGYFELPDIGDVE